MASQISVRLLGVCDHAALRVLADRVVLVGVGGGEAVSLLDAVEVLVERLVGEGLGGTSSVVVLLRVVTIFECPRLRFLLCRWVSSDVYVKEREHAREHAIQCREFVFRGMMRSLSS